MSVATRPGPEIWNYKLLGETGYRSRTSITPTELHAVLTELRYIDITERHAYAHGWITLVTAMMGRMSRTNTGRFFEDGRPRYDWHCHGPVKYTLYGYTDEVACYRAIASRLTRCGKTQLGKIESAASCAFSRMQLASMAESQVEYYPPYLCQQTSVNTGRQLGANAGRELTVFGAPAKVVAAVEKYGTTVIVTQASRSVTTDGKKSSASLLRFVGHLGNRGDYTIKRVEAIGETQLMVTLATPLRESVLRGASVYVGHNRAHTAGDRVQEIVEKIRLCKCREEKRLHHRTSCESKEISWQVHRRPAFSYDDGGVLSEDSDVQATVFGNFKVTHPNGCDCWFCIRLQKPAFDSIGNPRPPADFPPVRALRGPKVCSCNVPECHAMEKKPERTCEFGGLPCFEVTFFLDWTGFLAGTSLSDSPDHEYALRTRALAPPPEPVTLRDLGSREVDVTEDRLEHRTARGQITHTVWEARQQRVADLLDLESSAALNPTVTEEALLENERGGQVWNPCSGSTRPTVGDFVRLKISKEGLLRGNICRITRDDYTVQNRDTTPYALKKLGAGAEKTWFKEKHFVRVERSEDAADGAPASEMQRRVAMSARLDVAQARHAIAEVGGDDEERAAARLELATAKEVVEKDVQYAGAVRRVYKRTRGDPDGDDEYGHRRRNWPNTDPPPCVDIDSDD